MSALAHKLFSSRHFGRMVRRMHAVFYPPPYRRATMEFDHGVWGGLCAFPGEDGVPIGLPRADIVGDCRVAVLQWAARLRAGYLGRCGLADGRLTLHQGGVLAMIGVATVAYQVRRRQSPLSSLPALDTAAFTLGAWSCAVVQALVNRGDRCGLHDGPLTRAELGEVADRSGVPSPLPGTQAADSRTLALDFLDVLLNGSHVLPDSVPVRQAMGRLGDGAAFHAYAQAALRLEWLVRLVQLLCAQSLQALTRRAGALSPAEQPLVAQCLSRCHAASGAGGEDDRVVLGRSLQIVLELLAVLEASEVARGMGTRAALVRANLVKAGGGYLIDQAGGDVRVAAARRMRLAVEVVHPFCQQAFDVAHQALQRPGSPTITLDDLYTRCGGESLMPLLAMLEARVARGPVVAPA